MHVTLACGDAAMASDSHDCKCLRACFAEPGQHRVVKGMQNKLGRKTVDRLSLHNWPAPILADLLDIPGFAGQIASGGNTRY